ncbi:hypothetical protein F4861DRAFT_39444 [Xylaria intraflava]|nr:hypothetical protein F4861DRAFT_39444 [Xylaria intraflava]
MPPGLRKHGTCHRRREKEARLEPSPGITACDFINCVREKSSCSERYMHLGTNARLAVITRCYRSHTPGFLSEPTRRLIARHQWLGWLSFYTGNAAHIVGLTDIEHGMRMMAYVIRCLSTVWFLSSSQAEAQTTHVPYSVRMLRSHAVAEQSYIQTCYRTCRYTQPSGARMKGEPSRQPQTKTRQQDSAQVNSQSGVWEQNPDLENPHLLPLALEREAG